MPVLYISARCSRRNPLKLEKGAGINSHFLRRHFLRSTSLANKRPSIV